MSDPYIMTIWILLSVLVLIAALAPRFGVDTRDGQDWVRRTPTTTGRAGHRS